MIYILTFLVIMGVLFLADIRVYRHIKTSPEYVPIPQLTEFIKDVHGMNIEVFIDSAELNEMNAFTGGVIKKFLVLTTRTFNDTTNETLQAVLCHEIGHQVKYHPLQKMILIAFINTLALHLFYLYPLISLGVLVACLFFRDTVRDIIDPIMSDIYLFQEFEADAFAQARGYGPEIICYLSTSPNRQHNMRIKRIVEHAEKSL